MAKSKGSVVITLSAPIMQGEEKIKEIDIRKPKAGELRGLQLSMIMMQDMDSMMILLPRITCLKERDIHDLEPEDLANLSLAVLGFFVVAD